MGVCCRSLKSRKLSPSPRHTLTPGSPLERLRGKSFIFMLRKKIPAREEILWEIEVGKKSPAAEKSPGGGFAMAVDAAALTCRVRLWWAASGPMTFLMESFHLNLGWRFNSA